MFLSKWKHFAQSKKARREIINFLLVNQKNTEHIAFKSQPRVFDFGQSFFYWG